MNEYETTQIVTHPWNQPTTSQPQYIQTGYQQYQKPATVEDRLSAIEKDIKEIKELLEFIRWRI